MLLHVGSPGSISNSARIPESWEPGGPILDKANDGDNSLGLGKGHSALNFHQVGDVGGPKRDFHFVHKKLGCRKVPRLSWL